MRCPSVTAPGWPPENTCKLINANVKFLIRIDDKLLNFLETNVTADVRRAVVLKNESSLR